MNENKTGLVDRIKHALPWLTAKEQAAFGPPAAYVLELPGFLAAVEIGGSDADIIAAFGTATFERTCIVCLPFDVSKVKGLKGVSLNRVRLTERTPLAPARVLRRILAACPTHEPAPLALELDDAALERRRTMFAAELDRVRSLVARLGLRGVAIAELDPLRILVDFALASAKLWGLPPSELGALWKGAESASPDRFEALFPFNVFGADFDLQHAIGVKSAEEAQRKAVAAAERRRAKRPYKLADLGAIALARELGSEHSPASRMSIVRDGRELTLLDARYFPFALGGDRIAVQGTAGGVPVERVYILLPRETVLELSDEDLEKRHRPDEDELRKLFTLAHRAADPSPIVDWVDESGKEWAKRSAAMAEALEFFGPLLPVLRGSPDAQPWLFRIVLHNVCVRQLRIAPDLYALAFLDAMKRRPGAEDPRAALGLTLESVLSELAPLVDGTGNDVLCGLDGAVRSPS